MNPDTEGKGSVIPGRDDVFSLEDAVAALRHGVALAELALRGPDPEMAASYLSDAMKIAAPALLSRGYRPEPDLRPVE